MQVPESPPPATVDGCLGQAWDEAGEGHSAAPASSDGEGARNGGKVAGLQQEDLRSVEGMQWPVGIYCPLQMARALLGCVWVQGTGMG